MNIKNNIIQLPTEISNIISAGEVVERPLSIVKELVENSLDASASSIKIILEDGGLTRISVIDNGLGMNADELKTSILPHATSKIKAIEDLFRIETLGFRGEALPSIASVSQMKLTSNPGELGGYSYTYYGGVLIEEGRVAHPVGTTISVSNLFYNTPARLKHLGSSSKELSLISDYLVKCSISHPFVSFLLANQERIVFQSSGNGSVPEILDAAYGSISHNLVSFSGNDQLYTVSGFTTTNEVMRSNRNALIITVNSRVVKSLNLNYAITDAYDQLLPEGKFPVTVLEICCSYGLVDVNIHPSKLEVKLTEEHALKYLISSTIRKALLENQMGKQPGVTTFNLKVDNDIEGSDILSDSNPVNTYTPNKFSSAIIKGDRQTVTEKSEFETTINGTVKNYQTLDDLWAKYQKGNPVDAEDIYQKNEITADSSKNKGILSNNLFTSTINEEVQNPNNNYNRQFFRSMNYIGQFDKTYLILEYSHTLYLIDQHAAMERLNYENNLKRLEKKDTLTQDLLVPLTMNFPNSEFVLIMNCQELISQLGIKYSGENNVISVSSVPLWMASSNLMSILSDFFENFLSGVIPTKSLLLDKLAKSISCKQAIKANTLITRLEVDSLLEQLDCAENPFSCPHGRPAVIKMTQLDIEKLFKRVIS